MKDSYLTILKHSEGLYRDKGSRFISLAWPVSSEQEINNIIKTVKKDYHDARHHCYAWKLYGNEPCERVNDDGEPSGTAGKPILRQLNSRNLTDLIIIVVRYFGGVLLGKGGLINAYKAATEDSLKNAVITEKFLYDIFIVQSNYCDLNTIIRLVEEYKGELFNQDYNMECRARIKLRRNLSERFLQSFERLDRDKYIIRKL